MPYKFPVLPNTRKRSATEIAATETHYEAFDACHERYLECLEFRDLEGASLQEAVQNYILDFELAGRRTLGQQSERFDLFRLLFLEDRSAMECCGLLNMDRFTLTYEFMAVKRAVGEALINRGMFPLQRYFEPSLRPRTLSPVTRRRAA